MEVRILADGSQVYELDKQEIRLSIEELVREVNPYAGKFEVQHRAERVLKDLSQRHVKSLERALNSYRCKASIMRPAQLFKEKHKPKRLGRFLDVSGSCKPACEFEAHAVISGKHELAEAARMILARFGIRIDDPVNGVWLPNFQRNTPHEKMPLAPAHRTVHTKQYYANLTALLEDVDTKEELVEVLAKVKLRLMQGKFPYKAGDVIDVTDW